MSNPPEKKVFTSIPSLKITEEDTEAAVEQAKRYFGPIGRMEYPLTRNTIVNAVVSTKGHGKLWYGDLNPFDELEDRRLSLSAQLGEEVSITRG